MHQKILALAVAGLFALPAVAQSNVTISGMMAVSYNNYKVSDTTRPAATENRLDDGGSRFVIRGTEDLGGGMSAYFQIDNRISTDTRPNAAFGNAQGLADGETFVGIKHKDLGQIGFGKFEMHYHETKGHSEGYRIENSQLHGGTNLFSKINTTAIAGAGRLQNVIKYDTPNWNGFSAKLGYSFNPSCNEGNLSHVGAAGTVNQAANCASAYAAAPAAGAAVNDQYNKGGAWNVAARYKNGPINSFASYYQQDNEGAPRAGQESYRFGGDYTFPIGLKAGLNYDWSEIVGATAATDTKRTAWLLPVSYMTGAHGFYVTYARANDRKVGGTKLADSGATQWTLVYDYALSKRTVIGAAYINLKNDSAAIYSLHNAGVSTFGGSALTVAGENVRQLSLNLTHRF